LSEKYSTFVTKNGYQVESDSRSF